MTLTRTGGSVQSGFELYAEGSECAVPIWKRLMEAAKDLDVRAGCPNLIERIEGGLLSYGNDIGPDHTPLEAGFGKFCDLDRDLGCLGHQVLSNLHDLSRQIRPVTISGAKVPVVERLWPVKSDSGTVVESVSSAVWSPTQSTNVGIAMIDRDHWDPGTKLTVMNHEGLRDLQVTGKFWGRARFGHRLVQMSQISGYPNFCRLFVARKNRRQ